MKLYHGSNVEVKNPSLLYSSKTRDFGAGFYLTSSLEQAEVWAHKKALRLKNGKPYISIFTFDENSNLKIKYFSTPSEEWFDYVVKNRKNIIDEKENYDVVIGPIANDITFEILNLYMRGILTKEQAIIQLKTFKLKDQYTFKTEKSLKNLKYEGVLK